MSDVALRNVTGPFDVQESVDEFMKLGLKDGEILSEAQRYVLVRVERPVGMMDVGDADSLRLLQVDRFDSLRKALLEQHQIALEAVPGIGHRIVPPGEQVALAARKKHDRVTRTFAKASALLRHVRTAGLTVEQRQARNDEIARLDAERKAFQKPRRGF